MTSCLLTVQRFGLHGETLTCDENFQFDVSFMAYRMPELTNGEKSAVQLRASSATALRQPRHCGNSQRPGNFNCLRVTLQALRLQEQLSLCCLGQNFRKARQYVACFDVSA